jgi:uncharacterized protein (TIGR03067 family)
MTWATCWLILGTGLVHAFEQRAEEAQKKLQGTWTATKAERDGKAADDVVGHRISFTGNRFQIWSKDGKPLYAGTVRVDPSAKPAAIDFEHTEGSLKGKVWKGIYALDGDTLTTCDNAPDLDKNRPTAFEAKRGSGYVLIAFQRAERERERERERELTQLLKDLNVATVKADVAFLERVLHADYVHLRPRGTAENRSQYLKNRKTGRVAYEVLDWDEIKLRLNGDTAIVTGRSTVKGKDQRGVIDQQQRWTRVFLRRDRRWQLIHFQGTPVQRR